MIHVESSSQPPHVEAHLIQRAASAALASATASGDITVVLTDDSQVHDLNRSYLGIDATTDVLAFPGAETDPETGEPYLGDILISVPQAQAQAESAGHPLESEILLLVVHGTLHLLGYDHGDTESKTRMWLAQADILKRIGLGDVVIRET